jgi:hypothetical protein
VFRKTCCVIDGWLSLTDDNFIPFTEGTAEEPSLILFHYMTQQNFTSRLCEDLRHVMKSRRHWNSKAHIMYTYTYIRCRTVTNILRIAYHFKEAPRIMSLSKVNVDLETKEGLFVDLVY